MSPPTSSYPACVPAAACGTPPPSPPRARPAPARCSLHSGAVLRDARFRYEPAAWYYEIVECVRRLMLTGTQRLHDEQYDVGTTLNRIMRNYGQVGEFWFGMKDHVPLANLNPIVTTALGMQAAGRTVVIHSCLQRTSSFLEVSR